MPFPWIAAPQHTVRDSSCPSSGEEPEFFEFEAVDAFEEGPIELADAVYSLNNTFSAEARQARFFNRFDPRYPLHVCRLTRCAVRIAQAIVTINKYQPERRGDPECSPERLNDLYLEFSYHFRKTSAAAREACRCGNQFKLDEMFEQQTDLLHLLTRLFTTHKMLLEKPGTPKIRSEGLLQAGITPVAEESLCAVKNQQTAAVSADPHTSEPDAGTFKSVLAICAFSFNSQQQFEQNREKFQKKIGEPQKSSSLSEKGKTIEAILESFKSELGINLSEMPEPGTEETLSAEDGHQRMEISIPSVVQMQDFESPSSENLQSSSKRENFSLLSLWKGTYLDCPMNLNDLNTLRTVLLKHNNSG